MFEAPVRRVSLAALLGQADGVADAAPPALPDLLQAERMAGRAEGEALALERFTAEAEETARRHAAELATAHDTARAVQAELTGVFTESFATLLIDSLRAIFAAEPALGAETVHSLVAEALTAAPTDGGGRIAVHPAMLAAAQPMAPDGWRVEADARLAAGSVVARVDTSVFAASLARRLERLASLLEGAA